MEEPDTGTYCIRYVDMDTTIPGMTVEDDEGFYNIYINSRISCEEQEKTILHELSHIFDNDFYNDKIRRQTI